MPKRTASGEEILRAARRHLGERYILGCAVPKSNSRWTGPWDCAEFVSWIVYQTAGILYGCSRSSGDPATADAYTGYWHEDAKTRGIRIPVRRAICTPGAAILRVPQPGANGHIVISDGEGMTVEAHSSRLGVVESTTSNRRWDLGILVPGIEYVQGEPVEVPTPPPAVYRLKRPRMTGPVVKTIQRALRDAGFHPGNIDGVFGPLTHAAVVALQVSGGLVADGEVGARTAEVLGVTL